MNVLLTNDDGYDSPGLHAIAEALDGLVDVTVVAPEEDQSAMGRVRSAEVVLRSRERGYAISGTPVDCVIVAIEALELEPDAVVSGCNRGANLGGHALGRSGTVSAAVEATFFGLPALAVSLYVPPDRWPLDADISDFQEAAKATSYLVEHALTRDLLGDGGYLNVNAPMPAETPAPMRLTKLSNHYDMRTDRQGDRVAIRDRGWAQSEPRSAEGPTSTDRGTVIRGEISVTALTAPHRAVTEERLRPLIEAYDVRFGTTPTDGRDPETPES